MKLSVNGEERQVATDPETPLLWVLRDHLGLMGTKFGCGIGECGVCTVLIDGDPTPACQVSLEDAVGSAIVTIEGLGGAVAERVKRAWVAEQVPQCGYCQPGQIITATALLTETPQPTDGDVAMRMSSVLCRCGTYPEIRRASERAAEDRDHDADAEQTDGQ